MSATFIQADCLDWLKQQPADSVDLVLCSPPYEDARTYGIDFNLKGQEWVDWCLPRFIECVRVSRGLVCWVVEGKTRQFRYSCAPILLMADLHRAGVHLRKPPAMHRAGIPGSGGPDWLRNVYELIVVGSKGGRLAWSDNTAMGAECKYKTGGAMSNRTTDGQRINAKTGKRLIGNRGRPEVANPGNFHDRTYTATEVASMLDEAADEKNDVIEVKVGGGLMGSRLAHENEAPFTESLAEFFIRSFCRPDGTVLDIFSGSGTTACVAHRLGRVGVGIDIRESQVELGWRRLAETVVT